MEIEKQDINAAGLKILAKDGDTVIGWAIVYFLKNDRHNEPYAFLENVYVEQEYRKQGLGKQLVNAIIEQARANGCYKILATSRYSKPEVHKFYEKFGFKDWGKEFRLDLFDSKPIQRD